MFISPTNQYFRLIKNEEQEWGFYTEQHTWLNYKDAVNILGLKPVYKIHKKTLRRSQFYVDFELPKDNSDSFKLLDTFYSNTGVENLRLRDDSNVLRLSIKEGVYPAGEIDYSLFNLMKPTTYGTINFSKDQILVESNYKRHYFELPTVFIDKFIKIAVEKNLTQHELVEQIMNNFLNTYDEKNK